MDYDYHADIAARRAKVLAKMEEQNRIRKLKEQEEAMRRAKEQEENDWQAREQEGSDRKARSRKRVYKGREAGEYPKGQGAGGAHTTKICS